jgi:hypothetical protein
MPTDQNNTITTPTGPMARALAGLIDEQCRETREVAEECVRIAQREAGGGRGRGARAASEPRLKGYEEPSGPDWG